MANPQSPKGVVPQELTDALARINTETDNLAVTVTALRDQIKTTMTTQEVADVTSGLNAVADRLKGIGADPSEPVPPGPTPMFKKK